MHNLGIRCYRQHHHKQRGINSFFLKEYLAQEKDRKTEAAEQQECGHATQNVRPFMQNALAYMKVHSMTTVGKRDLPFITAFPPAISLLQIDHLLHASTWWTIKTESYFLRNWLQVLSRYKFSFLAEPVQIMVNKRNSNPCKTMSNRATTQISTPCTNWISQSRPFQIQPNNYAG